MNLQAFDYLFLYKKMHKSNASTDNNRSKRDLVSENKSRALIS